MIHIIKRKTININKLNEIPEDWKIISYEKNAEKQSINAYFGLPYSNKKYKVLIEKELGKINEDNFKD